MSGGISDLPATAACKRPARLSFGMKNSDSYRRISHYRGGRFVPLCLLSVVSASCIVFSVSACFVPLVSRLLGVLHAPLCFAAPSMCAPLFIYIVCLSFFHDTHARAPGFGACAFPSSRLRHRFACLNGPPRTSVSVCFCSSRPACCSEGELRQFRFPSSFLRCFWPLVHDSFVCGFCFSCASVHGSL